MKDKPKSVEDKCPLWMMTFGDCMSLLVTFFVMLIAFTSVEKDQLLEMVGSLKGALGVVPEIPGREISVDPNASRIFGNKIRPSWLSSKELSSIMPNADMIAKRYGKPKIGADSRHMIVRMLDAGMAFIISSKPLFEEGKSELLPGNEEMIQQLSMFSRGFLNEVRVVGVLQETTEINVSGVKTPIGLGIERAITIQEAMISAGGIKGDRFSLSAKIAEKDLDSTLFSKSEKRFLEGERIEVIVIGKHILKELSAEEIIVRDKWK